MKFRNLSREVLSYLVVGMLTTLVNFAIYYPLIYAGMDYKLATTAAFIGAVIFAFISNKKFVFLSKKGFLGEFIRFMVGRGATYLLDIGSLIFLVEALGISEYVSKIWASILVVISNYLISKFWTFR